MLTAKTKEVIQINNTRARPRDSRRNYKPVDPQKKPRKKRPNPAYAARHRATNRGYYREELRRAAEELAAESQRSITRVRRGHCLSLWCTVDYKKLQAFAELSFLADYTGSVGLIAWDCLPLRGANLNHDHEECIKRNGSILTERYSPDYHPHCDKLDRGHQAGQQGENPIDLMLELSIEVLPHPAKVRKLYKLHYERRQTGHAGMTPVQIRESLKTALTRPGYSLTDEVRRTHALLRLSHQLRGKEPHPGVCYLGCACTTYQPGNVRSPTLAHEYVPLHPAVGPGKIDLAVTFGELRNEYEENYVVGFKDFVHRVRDDLDPRVCGFHVALSVTVK